MRTRVKVCGITRSEDALAASIAGADALGFMFVKSSPRYISPVAAKRIIDKLPAFVASVGVFVDSSKAEIQEVLSQVHLDCIQFHGDESQEFCDSIGHPYIKAIRTKDRAVVEAAIADYSSASALLFDTYTPGIAGGTGKSFDWELFPESAVRACVLAGGLTPQNIAQSIEETRPYAVDVSSGVEVTKGIKDNKLIQKFMDGVKRGDFSAR